MTTKTYDGQTARFLASVATCMPPLSSDVMQGWIDNQQGLKKFLGGLNPSVVEGKKTVLNFREEVSVGPLKKRFVPNEFFVTRDEGLHLYNNMQHVLKNAQIVESAEAAKLRCFDLTMNAYDKEIKAELPQRREVALWQIAHLIEAQKNGEDGSLLTNGHANIFYVAGYAVNVNWHTADRRWCVSSWGLVGVSWDAGDRVFSSN